MSKSKPTNDQRFHIAHTYIIGHCNLSVRIMGLVSNNTYVVCINFIHEWRNLQFKINSGREIFEKLFHRNFIYFQRVCQKNFFFFFDTYIWPLIWTVASHLKPTSYLLDYGDLNNSKFCYQNSRCEGMCFTKLVNFFVVTNDLPNKPRILLQPNFTTVSVSVSGH